MARIDTTQRIAVLVDREGLGDCLLKLPMLRAIKQALPHSEVWWISNHESCMATALQPHTSHLIARVIVDQHLSDPLLKSLPRLWKLPRFDMVFDTRTKLLGVLWARMVLRPREFYACLPGFVLSHRRPPGLKKQPPGIGARALSMARAAFGADADGHGSLPCSTIAKEAALSALPPGPVYVGLALGSREPRKNWPLERFVAAAKALRESGIVPVFILGPFEQQWLETLRETVPDALFPPIGEIDGTLALIARMRLVVANDSGMGHLTAALGVPLISLFGPTEGKRWAPVGGDVRVVSAQDFGGETMDDIPLAPVISAIQDVLTSADRETR